MIGEIVRKKNWWVRGPLLLAMMFTFPVFFYFFVVGGYVSYSWLVMTALPTLLFPVNVFALVYAIHLVLYGFPMYWISGLLTRWICVYSGWRRAAALVAICAAMIAVGAQPIFGVSHGPIHGMNAYEILRNPMMKQTD